MKATQDMEVLPSIDLRDGDVVRLAQGDYARQTTYSSDPPAVAAQLAASGARWIHVVDLDAARTGKPTNTDAIRAIRQGVDVKIELGGGARNTETIDFMLEALADRVVVGSAALKNWSWFERLIQQRDDLAGRIALGLDARGGTLATEGWTKQTQTTPLQIAQRVTGLPLGAIIYTDITRDGMLAGPNIEATAELVAATDVPVIASGGVSCLQDVLECKRIGCAGVIIGRAYYERKIDLPDAVEAAHKN
ncbi:MAG: 1-(5-phosphoribosyl)-5-[(5-phosphoribosylamino)methylideneamino]imidazole-4-carboxamide isomerase [Phycisphaerae bacterium]|nr:1-(5-phosphoribosyl)-5-[(5-phosphoribosylamino)methylideneamino]imidazole-4-carboxamide isomerase [Phycisphaerae bacterium]